MPTYHPRITASANATERALDAVRAAAAEPDSRLRADKYEAAADFHYEARIDAERALVILKEKVEFHRHQFKLCREHAQRLNRESLQGDYPT